jgi:hypothetical protein
MPFYWMVPTTQGLDIQIYKVAASLHDISCKKVQLKGGHVFQYDEKNDKCIALARQYFTESVCTKVTGVIEDC